MFSLVQFVVLIVFHSWSHVLFFASPWTVACKVSLSSIISWNLLKFLFFELVMPSNHLIFCCPFFSCPESLPASGTFPITWLFTSVCQSIGTSASVSTLSSTTIWKHQFFSSQASLWSSSHICTWLLEKPAKWCFCLLILCLGLSKVFFWRASVF